MFFRPEAAGFDAQDVSRRAERRDHVVAVGIRYGFAGETCAGLRRSDLCRCNRSPGGIGHRSENASQTLCVGKQPKRQNHKNNHR